MILRLTIFLYKQVWPLPKMKTTDCATCTCKWEHYTPTGTYTQLINIKCFASKSFMTFRIYPHSTIWSHHKCTKVTIPQTYTVDLQVLAPLRNILSQDHYLLASVLRLGIKLTSPFWAYQLDSYTCTFRTALTTYMYTASQKLHIIYYALLYMYTDPINICGTYTFISWLCVLLFTVSSINKWRNLYRSINNKFCLVYKVNICSDQTLCNPARLCH